MPLRIPRLRRWFAGGAILVVLLVAGAYFYAKWRVSNALQEVPEKIGINIEQTAQGFTVSRSAAGRTIFKVEANPEGLIKPDQAPPKELKNPIHLKTTGLIFNQKTGNAYTKELVQFSTPQANGSAVGVNYVGKDNVLTLQSQVNVIFNGPTPSKLTADHGTITKNPKQVLLQHPHLQSRDKQLDADKATLFLRPDNVLDRVLARGNVLVQSETDPITRIRAAQLDALIGAKGDTFRQAVLS